MHYFYGVLTYELLIVVDCWVCEGGRVVEKMRRQFQT